MRILMVTPMLPYPETASAGPLGMYENWQTLRERHDVTLVSFAGPDPAEREAIERLRAAGNRIEVVWRTLPTGLARWRLRLRMIVLLATGRYPLRTLEFWEQSMQQLIDRVSAEQQFDAVQIEDNAMAVYRYPALPTLLDEHEVRVEPATSARDTAPAWRRALRAAEWRRWRRYQRWAWGRVDRVQVFTARDAANLGALAPDLAARVRVNPYGVRLPVLPAVPTDEPNTVVFVGGFNHAPNVDAALWLAHEIMPLVRAQRPDVRLYIVGNQPPPVVEQLARPDIIVTRRVPAIEPYLARAAVVIAPLREGGGMRMKVVQAMAHAKPLVTTPLGVEGLTVSGHEPPVLLGDDAATLARHVVALLDDGERRHALGQAARAFVREYVSWAQFGARLDATYAELLTEYQRKERP